MNKKKIICPLLLVLAVLGLFGCDRKAEETSNGYKVYFVDAAGKRLTEESYEPSAQTFEEMMDELMKQMTSPSPGNSSAIAGNVSYTGYERGIDALRVDFTDAYYSLNNIQAVLLQAAVVKTLCQIPGVTNVMLTVNKEQIRDSEGALVPAMNANSFIDTQEGGINSYLYATLMLYFPSLDSDTLVQELRNYHYSSNMVLERVVLEQLIEGPKESGARMLFNKGTKIQNLYIQKGVCLINLDEEANKTPSDNSPSPKVVIDAVVQSICDTCDGITGVKFEIDGDSSKLFRNEVDISQIFEPAKDISETEAKAAELPEAQTEIKQKTKSEETVEVPAPAKANVGVEPSLAEE